MLRSSATRLVTAVRGEGRRQLSARLTDLHGGRAGAGYARTTVRRVPVTVRLDPALLLERQRTSFADAVASVAASARVPFWWVPQPEGAAQVLCVLLEHRAALMAALAARAEPSWYVDGLDPTGAPEQRYLGAAGAAALRSPGLRLWEFVAPTAGSTFRADERQGLTVWFWRPDASQTLTCLVANRVVSTLLASDCAETDRVPTPLRARPSTRVGFPVDVVYTWVDGDDDTWLLAKARAAGAADPGLFTERAHDASRFAEHDELRHSLRALEQFAPWVNHVWVVTADQHPAWLRPDDPWVTVVSHADIWPDERGLPTFNSHAIEACLHRIPGLAEHFLYLNDDMVLTRPLEPENFFHPNGIGKFFQSNALVDHAGRAAGDIASTTAAKNARRLLGERYGVTFSRKFFHTAAALTVSGLAELEATFPDVVDRSRQAAFRTVEDVALAGSFYLNWAFVTGRAVPSRIRYAYIDPGAPDARERLGMLLRKRVFDAICVNDGSTAQTLEQRRQTDRLIREFFAEYLPVPGTFEIGADATAQTAPGSVRSNRLGSGK